MKSQEDVVPNERRMSRAGVMMGCVVKCLRRRCSVWVVVGACASLVAVHGEVSAQGFVPARGSGWAKVGYIDSRADANFAGRDEQRFAPGNEDGQRVPFRSRQGQVVGGTLTSREATLDVLYSPANRWVIGSFVPLFRYVSYSNTVNAYRTEARRPGDINLYGGYQLTQHDRLGVTLYGKVKIPTATKYPYTNEALSGEGQFDVSAALGGSYVILPNLHLNGTLEFKYRFGWLGNGKDPDGLYADPGEELHMGLGLGYGPTSWLWLSAGWTGFEGTPWLVQYTGEDEPIYRIERSFHAVMGSAYLMFGRWIGFDGLALDLFAKVPFTGEDHAVMTSYGVGLASSF